MESLLTVAPLYNEVKQVIYQVRTLSLTNVNFQAAYKVTSQLSVLAESKDKKNPDLNY